MIKQTCENGPAPAEARNGWLIGGRSGSSETCCVEKLNRSGRHVNYLEKYSEDDDEIKMTVDCLGWQFCESNQSKWSLALPGSNGEAYIEIVCRSLLVGKPDACQLRVMQNPQGKDSANC